MKFDIVSAGVGGQGVLSISAIIARSALANDLFVKQSEEHGMSQRGGSVVTHLRMNSGLVHSDIIPRGAADLIISLEPLESLRYLPWLAPDGMLLTDTEPVKNLAGYPDTSELFDRIRSLPRAHLIEATRLAREAGAKRAHNMVMVGAASVYLPLRPETLESCIREIFARKPQEMIEINLAAFRAGREAISCPPVLPCP